jgi:hypothetical protein
MTLLLSLLVSSVVFGTICGALTNDKNRGWSEGIIIGAVFGIFGLAIVAFTPAKPTP